MQEDYPTSAVYFCRCRVVFLCSFISALFLYFFLLHPYLKSSFTETFSPSKNLNESQVNAYVVKLLIVDKVTHCHAPPPSLDISHHMYNYCTKPATPKKQPCHQKGVHVLERHTATVEEARGNNAQRLTCQFFTYS